MTSLQKEHNLKANSMQTQCKIKDQFEKKKKKQIT